MFEFGEVVTSIKRNGCNVQNFTIQCLNQRQCFSHYFLRYQKRPLFDLRNYKNEDRAAEKMRAFCDRRMLRKLFSVRVTRLFRKRRKTIVFSIISELNITINRIHNVNNNIIIVKREAN